MRKSRPPPQRRRHPTKARGRDGFLRRAAGAILKRSRLATGVAAKLLETNSQVGFHTDIRIARLGKVTRAWSIARIDG